MSSTDLGREDYIQKSRYGELEIPEFKTTIPPALLEQKDEADKILYNSINIQNQQLNFLIKAAQENNRMLRITNGRVNVIESWKATLTSGWAVFLTGITVLGSLLGIGAALFTLLGGG